MYRLVLATLLALASSTSGAVTSGQNNLIDSRETDSAMRQAVDRATQSLDTFVTRFKHQEAGDSNFAVKVMIEDDYGVEHFWVTNLSLTDSGFAGVIANPSRTVKRVSLGQDVSFGPDIVTDWSYEHNGVTRGAYTLKVLLTRMTDEQATFYKNAVGWN